MLRKNIFLTIILALALCSLSAFAEINSVTPSTNDTNRTKGWAHVNQIDVKPGTTTLEFVSTRGFDSCFEYRTDGDTSQKTSETNYNPDITDGLYPFTCENNSTSEISFAADEYVEVRMVFGAERDERFDWTRFDVGEPCAAIQSGELLASDGSIIDTGFDEWGYNYQAHMFNGYYCDAYRDAAWCQEYKDIELIMKWNDEWLSNQDCDYDKHLDRHYGFDSYKGSGAWLTNHQKGTYIDENGKKRRWVYFCKIVAVPLDATLENGVWKTADGSEIGPEIWGDFAIIQVVGDDSGSGLHGAQYVSPYSTGFGKFSPK
jgi:hypothetical protein